MANEEKYNAKLQRVHDAIALEEPDTVPYMPVMQGYPFFQAGYTMADILYDTDYSKATESILRFLETYDPDIAMGQDYVMIGQGPIMELQEPKNMLWAGMPNSRIDSRSIHQFIEFPILEDGEFDEFMSDRTGWLLSKALPRTAKLADPLASFNLQDFGPFGGIGVIGDMISTPEMREMIQKLWKAAELGRENRANAERMTAAIEAAGYPCLARGMASVPLDTYSDSYRGTMDGLADLYARPELVREWCDENLEGQKSFIRMQARFLKGRYVFMPLHKGMDGFMSPAHYKEFYWDYLREIILTIIEEGMIPYIYTEGKYDTRLEFLADVPKGKVIYHFEEVDMAEAKRILGDTACIAGGMPVQSLDRKTPGQIRDEVKRIIDICAPGGGFIFETASGMDFAKPENVEAMTETVREYGKRG